MMAVLVSHSAVPSPDITVSSSRKSVLVFLRCGARDRLPRSEQAAAAFGFLVDYSDCEEATNAVDARETALLLRWVIRNFDLLSSSRWDKVVFNHGHETSWHQPDLASQLVKLFSSSYFREREFGELYPNFLCHKMDKGRVPYRGFDLLDVLALCLNGTSFQSFNRGQRGLQFWLSGQNTAFFVSARLLTSGRSVSDYKRVLENVHRVVVSMQPRLGLEDANYYVGEVFERAWTVLFTNRTVADVSVPSNFGRFNVVRFDPICAKVRGCQIPRLGISC